MQINRSCVKIQLNIGKAAFVAVHRNKFVCLTRSVSEVVTRNGKRTKFYQTSKLFSK